jgi:fermentation-respiration switch protein FrsA (DUF1100 family)
MRSMVQFLVFSVGFLATVYVAICALLYFQQDNLIFYRVTNDSVLARKWQSSRVEIATPETTIEGWWIDNPAAKNDVTILYFGGNAEDVLYTADSAASIGARRLLVANYRGYGGTPGKPSENALLADALAIYDYALQQPGVSADKIVVMGRSLGSGVATHIAANRPVRSVVLVTPYDSMAAVGQGHYRFLPVRLLLKHKFPSDEWAPKISAPVLIVAAEWDNIVPPAHAKRLFDVWKGPKQIHVLQRVGHNDIERDERYYQLIDSFLQ